MTQSKNLTACSEFAGVKFTTWISERHNLGDVSHTLQSPAGPDKYRLPNLLKPLACPSQGEAPERSESDKGSWKPSSSPGACAYGPSPLKGKEGLTYGNSSLRWALSSVASPPSLSCSQPDLSARRRAGLRLLACFYLP